MKKNFIIVLASSLALGSAIGAESPKLADSITQYGITWKFSKPQQVGQYVNGDWWVVGPVILHGISNTGYHVDGIKPGVGNDISIINPPTDNSARLDIGYDDTKFVKANDVSRPGGKGGPLISPSNPYTLQVNSSLMSCVSWLRGETTNKPEYGDRTRTIAVLTCVASAPPEGSFRPPYVGKDKTSHYNVRDIDMSALKNYSLEDLPEVPTLEELEKCLERVWFDVCDYTAEHILPNENLPTYGAYAIHMIMTCLLVLNCDFSYYGPGAEKKTLLYRALQLAIDTSGLADNGMSWAMSSSHLGGRKVLILFGGAVFKDPHMLSIGERPVHFAEQDNTFYVDQAEIAMTHSSAWDPDERNVTVQGTRQLPFEIEDLGEPMWGIRHICPDPDPRDNNSLDSIYTDISAGLYLSLTTFMRTMGIAHLYNHNALFDFTERYLAIYDYYDKSFFSQWREMRKDILEPTPIQVNYYSPYSTSGKLPPIDETSYYADSRIVLRNNSGKLERKGYSFGGWNTKPNGSGKTYAAGSTVSFSATTTLFPLWVAQ
jgi:hypothetical protein